MLDSEQIDILRGVAYGDAKPLDRIAACKELAACSTSDFDNIVSALSEIAADEFTKDVAKVKALSLLNKITSAPRADDVKPSELEDIKDKFRELYG